MFKAQSRRAGARLTGLTTLAFLAALLGAGTASAQNCSALLPSGGDDAGIINACFASAGRATLAAGTFLIYQPITAVGFDAGVSLVGAGKDLTKIYPQFACGAPGFLDTSFAFKTVIEVRRSPNSTVSGFHLDLDQLRKDCGHGGNYAITVNKSGGTRVSDVKITGSRYNDPGYTSGWAHGGGVLVLNSASSVVENCNIKDVGFSGGVSTGFSAIQIENSGSTRVSRNYVRRVAFGIEIVNKSPSQGYTGDSSNSVVTGNDVGGAALIGCPDCSHGRGLKFQACGSGDELPTRNVTVTNNSFVNFGGQSGGQFAVQGGSGLHLTCGVQYSLFQNNTFIGAPSAERCVVVDSNFNSPDNPTHHNTFNFNTFKSGRGQPGCNSECSDVEFVNDGPDQIGLDRRGAGTNTLNPYPGNGGSQGWSIRPRFTRNCQQYSHAWFVYPAGQTFIYRGQYLTVAAAGVRPPDFFSVATFRFKNASGVEVATYTTARSNSNCVINQELFYVNPSTFAPGLYQVFAQYYDGNAEDLFIGNDPIGTLDVR